MIRLFLAAVFSLQVHAQDAAPANGSRIFIDVGQGKVKRSLIALPPPIGLNENDSLYKVIRNDLKASGLFDFINPEAYLENPAEVGLKPSPGSPGGFNYANWKTIGTEFLFRASAVVDRGQIKFQTFVYHVPSMRVVIEKTYVEPLSSNRRLAHTFANDLVESLTGKRGMFLTKIAAARQDDATVSVKEIYVMDWDAANAKALTKDETISSSPSWSFKGDKIVYRQFGMHPKNKTRNADIFIHDLKTAKNSLVSYRKGLNSGAAFLPGDLALVLTMSFEGNSDIYRLAFDGTPPEALTRGPIGALNVEPAVSPDGTRLAFASDRTGNTHIFISGIDGSKPKRITMAGKLNASPAWSPDGKTIAFASDDSGHFDIYTISNDGQNLKRLTDARKSSGRPANHENPSWSPDGRHIVFSSDRTGNSQLYLITADGSNEYRITEDHYNWKTPKWSPYLD